jgi:DNA mismatch repair ATPase MutS
LPGPVIARARALLKVLEGEHLVPALAQGGRARPDTPADQFALFAPPDPLLERLRDVHADSLTPLQALALLAELSAAARGEPLQSVAPPSQKA